jgi:RES domain-containing protein
VPYAASSLSLACLETLVHLRDPANLPDFVYAEINIPAEEIAGWSRPEWETLPILESEELSREMGDCWLGGQSLAFMQLEHLGVSVPVIEVPSIVIPQERNYLINPEHPRFSRLIWSAPKPFRIDPRLIDPELR